MVFLFPLMWAAVMCLLWGTGFDQGVPAVLLAPTLLAVGAWFFYVPAWPVGGLVVRNVMAGAYACEGIILVAAALWHPFESDSILGAAALLAVFGFWDFRLLLAKIAVPRNGIDL
ncbi:MAG TPA: hypothetical protein VMV73_03120, partial [Candidatus Dormibacteraeota bacterium]|nr:hypothetical protein [Candidatus Dormibacteraeota bacterium]